jgi:phospholipid/cholesterol/gamma-HCH transport system substrate-binding protein
MASIKTKLFVGIFVIVGFAVAFIAVVWFGMSGQLQHGDFYAAYFDESIQGLNKDSPVKYRGVPVGRVESVGVAPDATLVEVIVKIDAESGFKPPPDTVAQLKSVGITGIMFVELDRKERDEPAFSPQINFPAKYPVLATKPSEMKKFISSIDEILSEIKSLDLKGISTRWKQTLDNINLAVQDARTREISSDIRTTLKKVERIAASVENAGSSLRPFLENAHTTVSNFNKTITRIDGVVAENRNAVSTAIANFDASMANANRLLENGDGFIKDSTVRVAVLQRHLASSLKNIENASENLNRLIELIADYPPRVIFGDPPPEKKVEPVR